MHVSAARREATITRLLDRQIEQNRQKLSDKSDLPGAQIAFIGQKIEKMFGKSDLRSLCRERRGELWNAA
jgi:hypothetical protein